MNRQDELLSQIRRIAKCGRTYFDSIYPTIADSDLRNAFAYMSEVKGKLIADLKPWAAQESDESMDQMSPAAMVEKMYRDAQSAFRASEPATAAKALRFGEEHLSRLVERAFDVTGDSALKNMLKAYYSQLLVCLEAMRRLRVRWAA